MRPARSKSRSPVDSRSQSPVLRQFLLYLASERGLADNSIHAYRRDLEGLELFLVEQRKVALLDGSVDDYRAYLQDQSRNGKATKTVARRLAAIRVFLR